MARDYEDSIDLKIINDKELLALFQDLAKNIQSQIVVGGLRKAGKLILDEARANWSAGKKNKSQTEYSAYKFAVQEIKKANSLGVKVGIPKSQNSYKIQWIEHGTQNREYKPKRKSIFSKKPTKVHTTGKILGIHFFEKAVEAKKQLAEDSISQAITANMERLVKKYSKK